MKMIMTVLLISTVALAADPPHSKNGKAAVSAAPSITDPPDKPGTKVVQYSELEVVRIKTKLRYMTLIVLPKQEEILDFTCGDKDWWVISGTQNFAYIKPAKAGAQTNLNLITASGNVYSFLLTEVSEKGSAEADLKVFVELQQGPMREAADSKRPRLYTDAQVQDYLHQVDIAQAETRRVKEAAQSTIDTGISRFISNVRFPYRFEAGKKPFLVRAMYDDGKFTYIQARPEETPALYELKDGKPNLINFQYRDGVYVVEKLLDSGYLAIGKQKLNFKRMD